MRDDCNDSRRLALVVVLMVLGALSTLSGGALANGAQPTPPAVQPTPAPAPTITPPAVIGAGAATMVTASNVGDQAWIWTGCPTTANPTQITGAIQLAARDITPADVTTTTSDTGDVVARFTYPATGGSQYVVRFTCINPTGMGFGGVGVLRPVFGGTGSTIPGWNLPRTLAYASVYGLANITRDGTTIAENEPALALVTQAIFNTDGRLMSEADPTRREVHLIVPGTLMEDGTAIQGFPDGMFYIMWPDAAVDIRNVGGTVRLTDISATGTTTPATTGRGPDQPAPITPMPLRVSVNNSGIQLSNTSPRAGLYQVTITNMTNTPRGIYMTGTDICCTEFNRYSTVLAPNRSQTFRFFFAEGPVTFRDMLSCERDQRSCVVAKYGPYKRTVTFR